MECQRYWLCWWFVRFDQPRWALHCSEQRSLIFSDHDHCGIGRQSRQIGFGFGRRAIRILGFRFSYAKERTGCFRRKIAVLDNRYWKHKRCRSVECLGSGMQRSSLRHDYSRRALHCACNFARTAKRGSKGDSGS